MRRAIQHSQESLNQLAQRYDLNPKTVAKWKKRTRVTDHRINLTLYKLDEIIEGSLEQVIEPLINEYQADQLAALGE